MKAQPHQVLLALPAPTVPRSKGTHASGIIRSVAIDLGILKPDAGDEHSMVDTRVITDPAAILRMSIGLAWEEWYIGVHLAKQGVKKHPGEVCVDGVYMTPDGLSQDVIITSLRGYQIPTRGVRANGPPSTKREDISIIHEVKATYKSLNTVGDLSKEWLWLTQIKAYCKGYKTRYARLHGLFLCGDYKMPITPQIKCWDLEFTDKEVNDNWDMLREYRDYKETQ